MSVTVSRQKLGRSTTVLAGIRAGGINLHRLPVRLSKHPVTMMEAKSKKICPLTVAGAAQVRLAQSKSITLLLPVELQPVNQAASTNAAYSNVKDFNH